MVKVSGLFEMGKMVDIVKGNFSLPSNKMPFLFEIAVLIRPSVELVSGVLVCRGS